MPHSFAVDSAGVDGPGPAKADYCLSIEPCALDIGPGISVKTLAYNSQVPGSLLRLREGVPVSINVTNGSENADLVHWHGLAIDSLNDGAIEEGSPMIPAGHTQRYSFTPWKGPFEPTPGLGGVESLLRRQSFISIGVIES